MSTRSLIGMVFEKCGGGRYVYCHSDGYPEWNGFLLQDHYTDPKIVEELVTGGNMSSLKSTIAECTNREPSWHVFRLPHGAESVDAKMLPTLQSHDLMGTEYFYVLIKGVWYVAALPWRPEHIRGVKWRKLEDVLARCSREAFTVRHRNCTGVWDEIPEQVNGCEDAGTITFPNFHIVPKTLKPFIDALDELCREHAVNDDYEFRFEAV